MINNLFKLINKKKKKEKKWQPKDFFFSFFNINLTKTQFNGAHKSRFVFFLKPFKLNPFLPN